MSVIEDAKNLLKVIVEMSAGITIEVDTELTPQGITAFITTPNPEKDLAILIGKNGNYARALRTISKRWAQRNGVHFTFFINGTDYTDDFTKKNEK